MKLIKRTDFADLLNCCEGGLKAAIFDMDGTIIDSMPTWRCLARDYLTENGIDADAAAAFQERIWGKNINEICLEISEEFLHGKKEAEVLAGIHDLLCRKYASVCRIKPHAVDLAKMLSGAGIPLCIATATHYEPAMFALRQHMLVKYFQSVLTVPEVGKSKFYPDIYEIAAKSMGAKPSETLVVEDAYYCVQTAKKAGFIVMGCPDSENEADTDSIKGICDYFLDVT
jgi:HAD superfamily hydrolase (TIGR01509 family)